MLGHIGLGAAEESEGLFDLNLTSSVQQELCFNEQKKTHPLTDNAFIFLKYQLHLVMANTTVTSNDNNQFWGYYNHFKI